MESLKDTEFVPGEMVKFMMDNGLIIKNMEKEYINFQMADHMTGNTKMI